MVAPVDAPGLTERVLARDRIVLIALIGTLFALSGLYTLLGVGMDMTALEMTAMRDMTDMPGPAEPGRWSLARAVLMVLMWWVMMAAMMLPVASPVILLHGALLRHRREAVPAGSALFLAGYLVAWGAFSLAATAVQWGLEASGHLSAGMMVLMGTVPGGLVLLAAGLFQFTPLKHVCLSRCRAPAVFLSARRRHGGLGTFVTGLEHGVHCLGCCWGLMALLFVGGIMNLYWIVGLAAFVAAEKLVPAGRIVAIAGGVILTGWGAAVLISAATGGS